MIIVDAIRRARTEYVVYFLLSAWLETLVHTGRARALPDEAARLPVRGSVDVRRRLHLIRHKLASENDMAPQGMRVLQDAACALDAARFKLSHLWARTRHRRWERLARRRLRPAWRLARNA